MSASPFTFGSILYSTKHDKNCRRLCQNYCVSTSVNVDWLGQVKYPTLNVRKSRVQKYFNTQLLPRKISNIYVRIMCIFQRFINSCLFGSNSQHSMLDFNSEKLPY